MTQHYSFFQRQSKRQPRIVLYSHDSMGLGHMRRNLLIAKTLAAPPTNAVVLMISGSRQLNRFSLPPGVDSLTLPALHKDLSGEYKSLRLDVAVTDLILIRQRIIRAAVNSFQPDVLIVDKKPLGMFGELRDTLDDLLLQKKTRCVLGFRDVLDDRESVLEEWNQSNYNEVIHTYYHAVWVYGDPSVYDMVNEYNIPGEVAAKISYTGYLNRRDSLTQKQADGYNPRIAHNLPDGPMALCMVGGGQDGAAVVEAFAGSIMPNNFTGLILTGPYMPLEDKKRLLGMVNTNPKLHVIDFVSEPNNLLNHADRVISMGGYNTVCELLSFSKNALVVPRVKPRREQLIRARCMSRLGLLDMLHPDEVTPEAINRWLSKETGPPPAAHQIIDLKGLERLPGLIYGGQSPQNVTVPANSNQAPEEFSYVS